MFILQNLKNCEWHDINNGALEDRYFLNMLQIAKNFYRSDDLQKLLIPDRYHEYIPPMHILNQCSCKFFTK